MQKPRLGRMFYVLLLLVGFVMVFFHSISHPMADAVLFVVGFYLIARGSSFFIDGATRIAEHFGVSEHVIGITLVAFATSLPELAVSAYASATGEGGIAAGNVLGSNVANILLVMGVAAIIMPLVATKEAVRDSIVMTAVMLLLLVVLLIDGTLDIFDGLLFLFLYVAYIVYVYRHPSNRTISTGEERVYELTMKKSSLYVIVGASGVLLGAQLLVDSAVRIAVFFNVPSYIIGVTIIAIGTSLPEMAGSVTAALKGKYGIAVGNVIGSNIANVLLILGVASCINPIRFGDMAGGGKAMVFDIPFIIVISIYTVVMIKRGITKRDGFVLLGLYATFLALQILM